MSNDEPRKISFQEAWETSTIFYMDEELEREIDQKVDALIRNGQNERVSLSAEVNVNDITEYIQEKRQGLEVILKDIGLSEEKFKRLVSLLRKLSKIRGGFDSEWGMPQIKRKIKTDTEFAKTIADLLVDGKRDPVLQLYVPKYYLEKLNFREIKGDTTEQRRIRYKESLIGTYGGRKGTKVEQMVENQLNEIKRKYGIGYESGKARIIDTTIDFAIPSLDDPYVIVMVSFMETTSSGQSTKTRDMAIGAYQKVHISNLTHNEDRAFVNFVDGGGWLARKNDFRRLVSECHYFINLKHLDMLAAIITKHVPRTYFRAE